MPPDDKARMRHMLEAAQKAIKLTQKRKRSDLDTDELLSLGLTRLLDIIDADVLWKTVKEDLPDLIKTLNKSK